MIDKYVPACIKLFAHISSSFSRISGSMLNFTGLKTAERIPSRNNTKRRIHIFLKTKPQNAKSKTANWRILTIFTITSFLYLSVISPAVAENNKNGSIKTATIRETIRDLLFSLKEIRSKTTKVAKADLKKLSLKMPRNWEA
jgi:hypothetical protein